MRKDIDGHEESAMKQHNRLLLQGNQSLQQKTAEQAESIRLLQQNQLYQLHQIVHKVKLADLVVDGEVEMWSDAKMIGGAHNAYIVQKGYAWNDDCCGVLLRQVDGPFPCHVTSTTEIVHWDELSSSTVKSDLTHAYKNTEKWGFLKFIPLSKLTAAASPYVNNGEVTFIITFRIVT